MGSGWNARFCFARPDFFRGHLFLILFGDFADGLLESLHSPTSETYLTAPRSWSLAELAEEPAPTAESTPAGRVVQYNLQAVLRRTSFGQTSFG